MIINYLDVFGDAANPSKAYPELIVNPNAKLAGTISL